LNDQTVTPAWTATGSTAVANKVTLAAGESTELRLQAAEQTAKTSTAQLKGIVITVGDSATEIALTDAYTNVAKWADLKITYKK
jgi:hypothetical protein